MSGRISENLFILSSRRRVAFCFPALRYDTTLEEGYPSPFNYGPVLPDFRGKGVDIWLAESLEGGSQRMNIENMW